MMMMIGVVDQLFVRFGLFVPSLRGEKLVGCYDGR